MKTQGNHFSKSQMRRLIKCHNFRNDNNKEISQKKMY